MYRPGGLAEVVGDSATAQQLVGYDHDDVVRRLVALGDQSELSLEQGDRLHESVSLVPDDSQIGDLRLADRGVPSVAKCEGWRIATMFTATIDPRG